MILVHRCARCGHSDIGGSKPHTQGGGQRQDEHGRDVWPRSRCGRGCHGEGECDWAEPVAVVTFGGPTMQRDPDLQRPGDHFTSGITACGCEDCHAAYRRMTRKAGTDG